MEKNEFKEVSETKTQNNSPAYLPLTDFLCSRVCMSVLLFVFE